MGYLGSWLGEQAVALLGWVKLKPINANFRVEKSTKSLGKPLHEFKLLKDQECWR
jgi:hypothetical protein